MQKREPPDIERIAIERVKKLRLEKRLTQEQLAERSDLTAESVTRVERGVRMPTLKTLGKLAHGLGVSPARLVDIELKGPVAKVSPHIAKIVAKLEDEDERVQAGAVSVLLAHLGALHAFVHPKKK